MILLGGLVALWGALVFGLAGMMHHRWKGMLASMRRAGVRNDIPWVEFFASADGLRKTRIAGVLGMVVGGGMIVAGLLRGGGIAG